MFSGSWADGVSNNLFNHQGIIKVSPLSLGQTIEQVLDDAINVGAEDVTGIVHMKYLTTKNFFYLLLKYYRLFPGL